MSEAVLRVIWVREFLAELGYEQLVSTPIRVDNQAAIAIAQNPLTTKTARHIRVRYHQVVREQAGGEIGFEYTPGRDNLADIFTKQLDTATFCTLRDRMMGRVPHSADVI